MTITPAHAPLTPEQRAQMEQAYAQMLSAVVQMARVLGKPCPVVNRAERRAILPATKEGRQ